MLCTEALHVFPHYAYIFAFLQVVAWEDGQHYIRDAVCMQNLKCIGNLASGEREAKQSKSMLARTILNSPLHMEKLIKTQVSENLFQCIFN